MIKSTLLVALLLATFNVASAQTDSAGVFTGKPDKMPMMKEGQKAWITFLQRNLAP